ncbi:MAG: metal-dependent hydrolase [Turneriella sp.]|nr:metal-dependent hydrolase [Turneriella sp.]
MLHEKALRNSPPRRPEKIVVRKPQWTFSELKGKKPRSEFGRMLFGALSLVFPEGERFFIRSVKRFADRVVDPQLAEDIKEFIGQEAQHGRVHELFNEAVLGHDYDITPFLDWYKKTMFGVVEPLAERLFGPKLALAVTAAAEHFTATWAAHGISSGYLEKYVSEQTLLDFMQWHAVEEIEHKHVAFDVLQQVDDSYFLRAAGMLVCAVLLPLTISVAFYSLLRQRPDLDIKAFLQDSLFEGVNGGMVRTFIPAIIEYLKPGFHPSDNDNYSAAQRIAQRIEARMAQVA